MSLIVNEINELRQLLTNFKDGKVTREDLDAQISIYIQTEKRVRNALTWASLMIKAGMEKEVKKILGGDIVGKIADIKKNPPMYDRTADRGT